MFLVDCALGKYETDKYSYELERIFERPKNKRNNLIVPQMGI